MGENIEKHYTLVEKNLRYPDDADTYLVITDGPLEKLMKKGKPFRWKMYELESYMRVGGFDPRVIGRKGSGTDFPQYERISQILTFKDRCKQVKSMAEEQSRRSARAREIFGVPEQ